MSANDKTYTGGEDHSFDSTSWSEILAARTDDAGRRKQVLGRILGHYWKPVFCYLRRKGTDIEHAKELTQGFFCDIVLGNELVLQAQREKGRFRSYLLTALNRYLCSVHRRDTAEKRRPPGGEISLDGFDEHALPCPSPQAAPDEAFAYAWAAELLRDVLDEVKNSLTPDDKQAYWQVFEARVVEPVFTGSNAPPLPEICRNLGIKDEVKASRMIVTVKRRCQSALRRHVRRYADNDEDVDREIAELMEILSKGRPA
jgi:RNA polymerase sigma-70 factor (ECF subfamily)